MQLSCRHSSRRFHRAARSHNRQRCKANTPATPGSGVASTPSLAWNTWVSKQKQLSTAVQEISRAAAESVDKNPPDVALVFVSSAHHLQYGQLVQLVRMNFPSIKLIVGSTGYGVIGNSEEGPVEIEHAHALSMTLATLPGVELRATHVRDGHMPSDDAPPREWAELLGAPESTTQPLSFVILAEPMSEQLPALLAGLDFAFPAANKAGGLSSAGMMSSRRALFHWSSTFDEADSGSSAGVLDSGAVVLMMHGGVVMESIIAQGCRPLCSTVWALEKVGQDAFGRRMVMSMKDASGRSMTPMDALASDVGQACKTAQERNHVLQNLTMGIEPGSSLSQPSDADAQDFLIRGMGPVSNLYMWIGDDVRPGQRVRFMVRDKQGAMDDLRSHALSFRRQQLQALVEGRSLPPPIGMLMFTCNGRGSELYNQPNYDATTVSDFIPTPISGFLCNGEIGRVGETTYLHGFTAAVAILRAAQVQANPDHTSQTNTDTQAATETETQQASTTDQP